LFGDGNAANLINPTAGIWTGSDTGTGARPRAVFTTPNPSAQVVLNTAGVDRLVVDTTGYVGIGTTSPSAALEVADSMRLDSTEAHSGLSFYNQVGTTDSNNPTGLVAWVDANKGNAYFSGFVSIGKQLSFDGLGSDNLTGAITVGNASDGVYIAHNVVNNVGSDAITLGNATTGIYLNGQGGFSITTNSVNVAGINTAGGAYFTSVACGQGCFASSDERLKKDISPLNLDAIDTVQKLKPVTFEWKKPKGNVGQGEQIGLIAQDLQKVLPQIVVTGDDKDKILSVKYDELIPVLIKAIQEQQVEIDALKQENAKRDQ